MKELSIYNILSVAEDLDRRLLLDYLFGKGFVLAHNLLDSSTSIITQGIDIERLNRSGLGIRVEKSDGIEALDARFLYVSVAILRQEKEDEPARYALDNMYRIFSWSKARIFTSFSPISPKEIVRLNQNIEDRISKIETRLSQSANNRDSGHGSSVSTDSYYKSYEKRLLSMGLSNMNDIMLSRYLAYKVSFAIEDTEDAHLFLEFLKSNSVVLETKSLYTKDLSQLFDNSGNMDSMPLSYTNASQIIAISANISRITRIITSGIGTGGNIQLGKYISSAIDETDEIVSISTKILNLGTMITGLPGTGKTKLAQNIISKSLEMGPSVAIISPTSEWNGFGGENGLKVLRLGSSDLRINLFKCETRNTVSFYENLSMLIASGCRAGPYRDSMEKCLLSALSKVYSRSMSPDPQEIYEEIEESVIEQHAKRSRASIKYTKHGENIRAALEGLRQLLMKPQFAYPHGISLKEAIMGGVIFDISGISNNSKALIYALLLNQIYTICDDFDLNGDDRLRLMVCLEEAQLVFNAEDESSATMDLKERIQNFRKNGVALMLITHNINDISPSIRRLCQNKFYFRQSPDIAKYAASDLVFGESEYEKVVGVLKTLGQRICAMNVVALENGERVVKGSVFAKVNQYQNTPYIEARAALQVQKDTAVDITCVNGTCLGKHYQILYLRERIREGSISGLSVIEGGLLEDRRYKFVILGERERDNKEYEIIGGIRNTIITQ